jgi:hypothetical protein
MRPWGRCTLRSVQQPSQRRIGLGRDDFDVVLALLFNGVQAPAATPARHMRVVLSWCRDQDMSFEEAWGTALRSIPRADADVPEWRAAIKATKAVWRQHWHRQPSPDAQSAA